MIIRTQGQTLVLGTLINRRGTPVNAYSNRAKTLSLTLPYTFSNDLEVYFGDTEAIGDIGTEAGMVLLSSARFTDEGILSPEPTRLQVIAQLSGSVDGGTP